MNTYDHRDPITFCSLCIKEAGLEPIEGVGICGRHTEQVLKASYEEAAAYRGALHRFKTSPDVQKAIENLREQHRLNRERNRSFYRRRLLLVLEIIAGALAAALLLGSAIGAMVALTK